MLYIMHSVKCTLDALHIDVRVCSLCRTFLRVL
jgi:hypothetical protein